MPPDPAPGSAKPRPASGRGKADQRGGAPAGVEADAAAVAVVPRRPAAARRLHEARVADQALDLVARHAALHGAQRLVGRARLRLAVARRRRRRWGLARLRQGERRLALLELREHGLHAILCGGHTLGDVREAIEHRRETLERLGLRLGPPRLLLLAVAAALAGRQRDVGRRVEDDLGLALVLDHLAPDPHLLAAVELLQLLGREVLEALRLDHGGEAAERRVEGEEAGELRAAHAEDPALDHHLLAHVLLGLVPRNDGLGPGGGDVDEARRDDRQCASQPERPRAPLDPAEAHSVKTAVTPTRPGSPTRSSAMSDYAGPLPVPTPETRRYW